ncbi:MAG: hypothetical protein IPG45_16330 [Deltaproteobacteria bacterium]|nr:hypothetical protein [Deltaproteobacteria bacterium]
MVSRESGRGVANLQVALFDVDTSGEVSPNPALFSSMSATGAQRLGSAITSANGGFALDFTKTAFAAGDPDGRPDVIFWVFAPEDTNVGGRGNTMKERFLHMSPQPIAAAGEQESIVIRIPDAILAAHGLVPADPAAIGEDALLAGLAVARKKRSAVGEGIDSDRIASVTAAKARAKAARAKLGDNIASSLPPIVLESAAYLRPGDSVRDRSRQIAQAAINAVTSTPSVLHLYPEEEDARELGIVGGVVPAAIPRGVVLDYIDRRLRSPILERRGTVLGRCREENETDRALESIEGALTEPEGCERPEVSPVTGSTQEFVRAQVGRQLGTATSAEEQLRYDVQPSAGDVVQSLSIRTGPADVTSKHDFHRLSLAFDHLWTEIFDKDANRLAKRLFEEVLQVSPDSIDDADLGQTWQDILDLREIASDDRGRLDTLHPVPPLVQDYLPEVDDVAWNILSRDTRAQLGVMLIAAQAYEASNPARSRQVVADAREIVRAAQSGSAQRFSRLDRALLELSQRLGEPHKFDVFAPNSANYGLMVTYRQTWEPLAYQVGRLVSTLPLAPQEVRRYTKRTVVQKTRAERQATGELRVREQQLAEASRADGEIVRRAKQNSHFQQTAEMSAQLGAYNFGGTTTMGADKSRESERTKRDLREATIRSSEQYRQQREVVVDTRTSQEVSELFAGEVRNPNDEITVTYLFYELQRRYQVQEAIHAVRPVILIARDVPSPNEIDEDWLIAHDWILKRVILDESFLPALEYVREGFASDDIALDALKANKEQVESLVASLRDQVLVQEELTNQSFNRLQQLMGAAAGAADREALRDDVATVVFGPLSELFSGGDGDEASELRIEAAREALDRIKLESERLRARLEQQVDALQKSTEKYVEAARRRTERRLALTRLRVHVKENILHYMQALWDHEPPDQRYFALYDLPVPWVTGLPDVGEAAESFLDDAITLDDEETRQPVRVRLGLSGTTIEERRLGAVADLDTPLGYKGNYMIFPLRERDYLTTWMAQDYIDERVGVRDPDERAMLTADEILSYAECLKARAPERYRERREVIRAALRKRIGRRGSDKTEIIVPSDSLFIEAIPGTHAILEDFKLVHRILDAKKVQSEVRFGELENVRLASRLLEEERGDPNVDKYVVVDSGNVTVDPSRP